MLLEPVIPWLRQAIFAVVFDAEEYKMYVGSRGLQLATRGEEMGMWQVTRDLTKRTRHNVS
jgi:hypothetical protein